VAASFVEEALHGSFPALRYNASFTYFAICHAIGETHELISLSRFSQHLPEITLARLQNIWCTCDNGATVLVAETFPNLSCAGTEVVQSAIAK
jgi:hypothetical protein